MDDRMHYHHTLESAATCISDSFFLFVFFRAKEFLKYIKYDPQTVPDCATLPLSNISHKDSLISFSSQAGVNYGSRCKAWQVEWQGLILVKRINHHTQWYIFYIRNTKKLGLACSVWQNLWKRVATTNLDDIMWHHLTRTKIPHLLQ